MRQILTVGNCRLVVDAPKLSLVVRESFYRAGHMIGILDLGVARSSDAGVNQPQPALWALFITAPRIELQSLLWEEAIQVAFGSKQSSATV